MSVYSRVYYIRRRNLSTTSLSLDFQWDCGSTRRNSFFFSVFLFGRNNGRGNSNEIFDSARWLVEKILAETARGTALLFSRQAKIKCGVTSWFSLFLCLLRNRSEIVGVVSTSHDPNAHLLGIHILFGSMRRTRETGYFCFIIAMLAACIFLFVNWDFLGFFRNRKLTLSDSSFSLLLVSQGKTFVSRACVHTKIQFLFVSSQNFLFQKKSLFLWLAYSRRRHFFKQRAITEPRINGIEFTWNIRTQRIIR